MAAFADRVKSIHPVRSQSPPVTSLGSLQLHLLVVSVRLVVLATAAPSHIEILWVLAVARLKAPFPLHSSLPALFSEYQ